MTGSEDHDYAAHDGVGWVFATRLREVRVLRGITARELSERLTELGAPMSRSSIAKLETEPWRAKYVRLESVLAISAALGVSPLWMITPKDPNEYVCITPRLRQPAGMVRDWMCGGFDPDHHFMVLDMHECAPQHA